MLEGIATDSYAKQSIDLVNDNMQRNQLWSFLSFRSSMKDGSFTVIPTTKKSGSPLHTHFAS